MKYLFAPICAFHMYAVGYEVNHHPPFSVRRLHITGCKCKLINFNQYNLRVCIYAFFFVATYSFVPPFRKAKFRGVPSRAMVKFGCAVGTKK
jgi:hypothetical protein